MAIMKSKCEHFKRLCNEADTNPWGGAYKTVISKVKGKRSPPISSRTLLDEIVTDLFPQNVSTANLPTVEIGTAEVPMVSEKEVLEAADKIVGNKAPGLDSISNKALKAAVKIAPNMFAEAFTTCLKEGAFPTQWKKQKLILVPKPNKPLGEASSYRPICLLNNTGKLFERVIYNRLIRIAEKDGGLSENQFGFRKGRSTTDALVLVANTAKTALDEGKCCAVITLDVKNAFNSARWSKILESLINLGVAKYLVRIVADFLIDRTLCCESDEGMKSYQTTCGVPQGSVLGPLLWIIMYNGVLTLDLPTGVASIGFADDIGVTVVARLLEEVELYANEAVYEIKSWLENAGLQLAEHKTEVVLITKRRKCTSMKIKVGTQTIYSKPALKYLGVMIDQRLNFRLHVEGAATKAYNIGALVARMLPNIGGPRPSRRLLISRVVSSILLYAAPVWADALENTINKKKIGAAYRISVLRTCCAYRTISNEAACVIAGMIPIEILAKEIQRLYDRTYLTGESPARRRQFARAETVAEWQEKWDESEKGRWTHKIIWDIRKWIERPHGEVGFDLTQFLSGHGGYRAYLYRFGRDDSPYCPQCANIPEDAEHVFFHCPRFETQRATLEATTGEHFTPENIMELMVKAKGIWTEVEKVITAIGKKLRQEEVIRKNERERNTNVDMSAE